MIPAAWEARHFTNVQPALVAFLAGGIAWLAGLAAGKWGRRRAWAATIAAAAACSFLLESFQFPQRRYYGFSEAASELARDRALGGAPFLVCSDSNGEGAFIAAFAAQDRRPGRIILRGNKMLAAMNWTGNVYKARFTTPAEIMRFIENVPVRVLILESSPGRTRTVHEQLTEEMIRQYPERWALIGSYPKLRAASPPGVKVVAYRLTGREAQPRSRIRIEMHGRLGRVIEN
jgi:hypothetical protein